jgi:hypothetical protein
MGNFRPSLWPASQVGSRVCLLGLGASSFSLPGVDVLTGPLEGGTGALTVCVDGVRLQGLEVSGGP